MAQEELPQEDYRDDQSEAIYSVSSRLDSVVVSIYALTAVTVGASVALTIVGGLLAFALFYVARTIQKFGTSAESPPRQTPTMPPQSMPRQRP